MLNIKKALNSVYKIVIILKYNKLFKLERVIMMIRMITDEV